MGAPVETFIQLPDDAGNTGKKDREQSRVVGANTVYEKFVVRVRQAQVLGVYRAALPQQTVLLTAQNGTTTGILWAHVPIAVTNKKARLRRLYVSSQHGSALATPTAPRIVMQRMTFTGTASGAAVTAAKNDSSYPTPVFDLRTAVTGLTPTLVAAMGAAPVVGALTAVGAYAPAVIDVFPAASEEDEWNVFAPGEGFVLFQDTAGTTSDTRVSNIVMLWDEIDTA